MTAKTDATCTGPGPDGTVCGRHAKYKGLCDTRWLTRRGDADVLEMLGLAS